MTDRERRRKRRRRRRRRRERHYIYYWTGKHTYCSVGSQAMPACPSGKR
jgi:hypothetical protein